MAEADAKTEEVTADGGAAEVVRARIGQTKCTGLVAEWRGYMGWIVPLIKVDHEKATMHKGRIYLNQKDVVQNAGLKVQEGSIVDFYVYNDHDGLGAEDCQCRTVLRMTLAHSEVNKLGLKPQWSEYLSGSEFYPEFLTEHNVLLRKYTWSLPFALLELWGDSDSLAKAAIHLATVHKAEKADGTEECDLRLLISEANISKVEGLPTSPKVSEHAIVTTPTRCRSVNFASSSEKCLEATVAFIQATAVAAA